MYRQTKNQPAQPRGYWGNLALVAIAGSGGCISVIVVISALLIGLLADSASDRFPLFTICAVVLSVPVSLWLMVRVMLWSVKAIERRQFGPRDQDNLL